MRILSHKKISPGNRLKLMLVLAYLRTGNFLLKAAQALLFGKNSDPKHILVFRTGSLGDNICAIPSLAGIRKHYPRARIDILVNAGAANLVSLKQLLDQNQYDEIIDYLNMPRRELIQMMRNRKYELVIQLPQTGAPLARLFRDLIFFRMICKSGFGWRLSTVQFFRKVQEKYISFDNETLRLANLLSDYGIKVTVDEYALNFTDQDQRELQQCIDAKPLDQTRPAIAIVVGAKRPQNRWPAAYFNEVIQAFSSHYNIFLVGGPEDISITDRLEKGNNVHVFCGLLTPLQSALLLKKCKLVLSNDTGPMHLAYAVGTPVVAIFSSRDFPGKWFPPSSEKNHVFRSYDVECSLCLSETCANNICMQQIKPVDVISRVKTMLDN